MQMLLRQIPDLLFNLIMGQPALLKIAIFKITEQSTSYGDIVIGTTGTDTVTISGNNIHDKAGAQPYQAIYCNNATATMTVFNNNVYNWSGERNIFIRC